MAKIAKAIGLPLMDWQRQVLDVAGELLPSGLPAYREVRVTVPRQSGKTTMILVLQVDRSLNWGPMQRTLYAAQDRNNSRSKWEEQVKILRRTPLAPLFTVRRQTGLEQTVWTPTDSTVGITASGETSGHGQTLDLGIVDEAFAQRDERLAQAFQPAMVTRANAQMWVVSTAGTDESVFLRDRVEDGRARVEDGQTSGVAYFEWSADDSSDPDDPATWWRCMPALGRTVKLDTIATDHDSMDAGEFARAYLNRWTTAGRPVFDPGAWQACADPHSSLAGLVCFALDVTPMRDRAAVAVCGRRADGRMHVEVVDARPGTDWCAARLAELVRRWSSLKVVIDPASPAGSLLVDLDALGVGYETVTTRDYAQACGAFFDSVGDRRVAHLDQPVLNGAVGAARKRSIADAWAWSRRMGGDVSPLVAVTLAHWGMVKAGNGVPQIL